MMPILHLGPLQLKVCGRPFARMMIPSVGEQDPADIQEEASDRGRLSHTLCFRRSPHRCHRICASSNGIATPSQYGITRAV